MNAQNLLTYFGLGTTKFDSKIWQNSPRRRKCFVKYIIESQMCIGKNAKQIVDLLGIDRKVYSHGVWSYYAPSFSFSSGKRYLNLHFDSNNIVTNARIKTRTKLSLNAFLSVV